MLFDKLSLFADGTTVHKAANAATYSRVLDLRRCGEIGIDGGLRLYGQVVGAPNASGSVTTVVQTSADGSAWTDLASQPQSGNILLAMFLPFGLKRYLRLKFAVGAAALSADVRVKAGLVDQFDAGALPPLQGLPSPGGSGGMVEDLAEDALYTPLALAAASGSIAKGASGTVGVLAGRVTAVEAPNGYTVTATGSTVTVALASGAASGTVTLVDGLGNKVAYAVTAT